MRESARPCRDPDRTRLSVRRLIGVEPAHYPRLSQNYPPNDVCINIIYMVISSLNYGGAGALIMCKIDSWEKCSDRAAAGEEPVMDSAKKMQCRKGGEGGGGNLFLSHSSLSLCFFFPIKNTPDQH